MVVDINSYDVLFGLDFLIKIGVIVDVEWGLIQVKHGPRNNVKVLPLTMVNMLQIMKLETLMQDVVAALESRHLSGDSDMTIGNPSLYDPIMPEQVDALVSNSNIDMDNNEHFNERLNGDEYEFGNIELEDLVLLEGP